MLKHFAHCIALTGLIALLLEAALAQNNELGSVARVNLRFDFYAGQTMLPAGVYTFDVDPVAHVVTIEQDATGRVCFLSGAPADPVQAGNSLLTFERVRGEYRLKELQAEVGGVEFPVGAAGRYEAH